MIDLHCHILPGLDDGPETVDEAVEMCLIAHKDGIRTIVATPHFRPGRYDYSEEAVISALEGLRSEVARRGIDLKILAGADVTVTPELPLHLSMRRGLTINNAGRYFLAELPNGAVPARWDQYLLSMTSRGFSPILTHPERNGWFLSHRDALYPFVSAGGLVQITAKSITGGAREDVREYCHFLLRRNLVQVIATDAHSLDQRPPVLSEAVKTAADIIGETSAFRLVRDNPRAIIEGRTFEVPEPVMRVPEKRKWYQRILDL
jgi:protein-tyrosine phosphatase